MSADPLTPMASYDDVYGAQQAQEAQEGGLSAPNALLAQPRETGWPTLRPEARLGLVGEIVDAIEPHTEADPAGILLGLLVSIGAAVNAGPHVAVGATQHPARLNAVLVGETSRGRKGQGQREVERIIEIADPVFAAERIMGGLASGEGLIAVVRDPTDDEDQPGSPDKRLLVVEPEFARVLKVANREGNTLSTVIRQAWDSGRLRSMTRRDPLVASDAHVAILGHVTRDELRRTLTDTDVANGFANRFLYGCVRRARLLPDGGELTRAEVERLGGELKVRIREARKVGAVTRTPEAAERWRDLYQQMADADVGGMVGAVNARAEAQVLRLSLTYAIADVSSTINLDHMEAAWAVWNYCESSAAYIFGDSTGDEIADRLLAALRKRPKGMTLTEQSELFGRHVASGRRKTARELLVRLGHTVEREVETDGRSAVVTMLREVER
jgi:hypothetical protein